MDIVVVRSEALSSRYDNRYVIVNTATGEVVDDAQGYGYKTKQKAHAAYGYKHRDMSKDKEIKKREAIIRRWTKEHPDFIRLMDDIAFDIAKGSYGPNKTFNAKLVKEMLAENGYKNLPFKPGELMRYWKKHC